MGHVDIDKLFEIYYEINSIKKRYNLKLDFKIDKGDFETAIEFWEMGHHHPPKSANWDESKKEGTTIICPDLLDYQHKIIIEYEEEPKPGKRGGKLGKKGHSEESAKDTKRDFYYRIGGFRLFKIWESDYNWRANLESFLTDLRTLQ